MGLRDSAQGLKSCLGAQRRPGRTWQGSARAFVSERQPVAADGVCGVLLIAGCVIGPLRALAKPTLRFSAQ